MSGNDSIPANLGPARLSDAKVNLSEQMNKVQADYIKFFENAPPSTSMSMQGWSVESSETKPPTVLDLSPEETLLLNESLENEKKAQSKNSE